MPVGYYSAVLLYLIEMLPRVDRREREERSAVSDPTLPTPLVTCVNECKLFAPIQPFSYFIRSLVASIATSTNQLSYQNHFVDFLWRFVAKG